MSIISRCYQRYDFRVSNTEVSWFTKKFTPAAMNILRDVTKLESVYISSERKLVSESTILAKDLNRRQLLKLLKRVAFHDQVDNPSIRGNF